MAMTPNRAFSVIRFFEHLGLLVFLGGLIYLAWWFVERDTVTNQAAAIALAVSMVGVSIFLYAGNKLGKKIELLLAQADFTFNAEFLTLFERSPAPYIIIDTSGTITRLNQSAVKLLRAQRDELIGLRLLRQLRESSSGDVSILVNKITSGMTMNDVKVSVEVETGEQVWVLLSAYKSQQNTQIILTLVDITQAKKIDIAKSEFLALATHQLRTPIAAIRWNAELLGKRMAKESNDAAEKYVGKIQSNTARMSVLIDDFLNVSKLELGTFATEPKPINLTQFIDDIIDEFGEKLSGKNISLKRNENVPEFSINTDERLLHIIMSNLVSNATKYVNEEGTISITTQVIDKKLRIHIADDGIGIPKEELDKIFTKFYRASNAAKHQAEGTGLGLYIVKQAVELLGGTIALETDSQQGAEFTITLPI